MSKWNLIVDIDKCTNCNLCVLAAQDEYVGNSFPGYAAEMPKHGAQWIRLERTERGIGERVDISYLPVMCQHCDEAPCIKESQNGAITKRPDGIVVIDPVRAKGQKQLVDSCPYGAIWWNEDLQLPQHWIFDAHLLDQGWKEPRAASACATEAIKAIKCSDAEMARIAEDESLETYMPEEGTKPRVHYKNLHRVTKVFIAGSVEQEVNDAVDCVEGADVRLVKDGVQVGAEKTDTYGDFKFEGLDRNSGDYTIEISMEGQATKTLSATVKDSVVLDDVRV